MLGFTISSPVPSSSLGRQGGENKTYFCAGRPNHLKTSQNGDGGGALPKTRIFLSKGSPEPPPKIKGSEKVFSFFLRNKDAKDYIEVFSYHYGGGRTGCFKYRKAVSCYEHGR